MGFLSSIAGPVIGAVGGLIGGKQTNDASAKAAERANMFTTEQMQNRHQWEVQDLKAAGLNPVLSAGGTPSMGSSAKADVINPVDSAAQAANSAMQMKRVDAEIDLMRDQARAALQTSGAAVDNAVSNRIAANAGAENNIASARLANVATIQKGALSPAYEAVGTATRNIKKGVDSRADNYRKKGFMHSSTPVLDWGFAKFGFGNSAKSVK